MTRKDIRDYVRIEADELTEAPEGLFLDTELNLLINISQQNIAIALAPYIPWALTKPFLISTTANKREYDVSTDFSITDLFMMFGIFHNEVGYKQKELPYLEIDQLVEYYVIGETGDSKSWSWDSPGVIALDPCPDQSVTNKFRGRYIPVFKDLNQDTEHNPAQNKYAIPFNGSTMLTPAHSLIALDVMKQWHLRSEEESTDIDKRYKETFALVINTMSMAQGVMIKMRPDIKEMIKR